MATAAVRKPRPRTPDADAAPARRESHERGLIALRGMPRARIVELLRSAERMARSGAPRVLEGRTVATLFFEDSTRTRTSFTLAAQRLGASVVDLGSSSSVNKGETLVDTARTIEAMGVAAMVVRTKQGGAAEMIARALRTPIINAGDGRHEHPTQGLLDAWTIATAHGRDGFDLSGLTVAIVGDVVNSRVARSNIACLSTLGARTICVGPPSMAPRSLESLGTSVSHDFDRVLPLADVVMMLRIQFERHGTGQDAKTGEQPRAGASIASVREYRACYGLTRERGAALKRGAVVLHPGPMNRGLEIDAEVADGPRSLVLRQVANGVPLRMAVLASVVGA